MLYMRYFLTYTMKDSIAGHMHMRTGQGRVAESLLEKNLQSADPRP